MTEMAAPRTALWLPCALALVAAAALALWLSRAPAPELPFGGEGGEVRAERAYGQLPLAFEPSAGRLSEGVDFVSHSATGTVALGRDGATLALGHGKRAEAISLELAGATAAEPRALECLPGVVNDLRGDDPERWRTDIPTFERVRYPSVWLGIGLDWYGNQGRLEYDFRLAPGADPDRIAIRVAGADRLRLAPNGDLLVTAGGKTIRQRAPIAYQPAGEAHASRTPVDSAFAPSVDTVRFRLGPYDRTRPLVIDPLILSYSTYLGGNNADFGDGIAVDPSGAAYVTGETHSTDFDTVGGIEGGSAGGDAFVSKLTPSGNALEYSTYLGGDGPDGGSGIAVDGSGAAYVTGHTGSSDFNTVDEIEGDSGDADAFVSKLTPVGSALEYSTYLGGNDLDVGRAIAVDGSGAAYVTGSTHSTDFDTVAAIEGDSADGGLTDAFVTKLPPEGDALEYSTYLGGDGSDEGNAIGVDSAGAAYVTGHTGSSDFDTVGGIEGDSASDDAFVSKLAPAGGALEYSTYLGGNGFDLARAIAVDTSGAAYVTGFTGSTDFNTVGAIEGNSGSFDAFVSKLTPAGGALAYSTYLGSGRSEAGTGIAVDASGAAYVTGATISSNFDTVDAIEGDSASTDAFVTKLTSSGSAFEYSTYLGGNSSDEGHGIAVDSAGSAYVTGSTDSSDFNSVGEIAENSASSDAFVSKLTFCTIMGTPGDDTLIGTAGPDTICGLGGDDVIEGKAGDDRLPGGEGNDVLVGSFGDDILDGGPGRDRASYYADTTRGIHLNLATGVAAAANLGTDTIAKSGGVSTVERAEGSRFDDTLVGDGQDNELAGNDGDDRIIAAGGHDTLIGAAGADKLSGERGDDRLGPGPGDDPTVSGGRNSDTLRYANVSGGGVSVDLAAGTVAPLAGSNSGTDTLSADIENAIGSAGDDDLSALLAGIASVLEGGDGADALDTSDGDALDSAKGGDGTDACTTDGGDKRSSCP